MSTTWRHTVAFLCVVSIVTSPRHGNGRLSAKGSLVHIEDGRAIDGVISLRRHPPYDFIVRISALAIATSLPKAIAIRDKFVRGIVTD
jgi:hypothetical protein